MTMAVNTSAAGSGSATGPWPTKMGAGGGHSPPTRGQRRGGGGGGGRKEGQGKFAHDLSMQRMYAIRVYPMRSGNLAVGHCGAASG